MKLMLHGSVDLHVRSDGRIGLELGALEVHVCADEPDGPAADAVDFGGATPGQRAAHTRWHVLRGLRDPECGLCAAADTSIDTSIPSIDQGLEGLDLIPRSINDAGELIDLDRPDVAALRARWSRGGKRKAALSPADLALLDRIARDPMTGDDEAAGREWSAGIIRNAKRGGDLVGQLRRTFDELGQPAAPPPPDPVQAAENTARRREGILAEYRALVERGEASDTIRAELARLEARYAPPASSPATQ